MANMLSKVRWTILRILQLFRGFRLWQARLLSRCRWWLNLTILGRTPKFAKHPKNPAMIGTNVRDLALFTNCCLDNENDLVTVYDPSRSVNATSNALQNALKE